MSLTRSWKSCSVVNVLALAAIAGCAPRATVVSSGGPTIAQAQEESYDGPKARIAVVAGKREVSMGTFNLASTDSDSKRVAEMLATQLFHTNRFIVIERQNLMDVLREQDLSSAGRIREGTGAPTGQIEGAEMLVTCDVTEKDKGNRGGGILLLGGLRHSHIAVDIRLVDARTSRLLSAATVEGRSSQWHAGIPLVAGIDARTPMDKAIRVAVAEAVRYVVSQTPPQYYHR